MDLATIIADFKLLSNDFKDMGKSGLPMAISY